MSTRRSPLKPKCLANSQQGWSLIQPEPTPPPSSDVDLNFRALEKLTARYISVPCGHLPPRLKAVSDVRLQKLAASIHQLAVRCYIAEDAHMRLEAGYMQMQMHCLKSSATSREDLTGVVDGLRSEIVGVTKTLASMNLRQAWDQAEDALCAQLDAMCEAGSKALEVKKHGQIHGVFEVVPLSLVAGVTEAKPSSTTSALRKKSPHPESSPIPSNLVDEGYPDDGMEVREDANDVRPQTPSGYPLSSSTSTGSDAHHPASRGPDELTPLRVIRLKTSVHTSSIPVHCSNPSEPVLETLTVKHMTPEKAKHRMRKGLVKVSEEEKSSRRKQSSPSSARPVAEAGGREIRSTGLKADDMDWVRTVEKRPSQ